MHKLTTSLTLAALLIATLAFTLYSTVYSQRGDAVNLDDVRLLEGGVTHQLPVDVTLVIPTDSGPQTVTVPLMLNLNLTIGPVDAIHLDVQAESAVQFVSPLHEVHEVGAITSTLEVTSSAEITGGDVVTD